MLKAAFVLWASACVAAGPAAVRAAIPTYGVDIVHTYPHDPTAFTEGLFYLNGYLYESTGLEQHSTIRKVKLETGEVLQKLDLPPQYFGEGIVNWQSHLISLTWRSEVGFVFDLATLKRQRQFHYAGEGWALTQDGKQILMSDGTPQIRFINPQTLKEAGRITVTLDGKPVRNVNELEWVKGEIYANVWQTDWILRIDPHDGRVVGLDQSRGATARVGSNPGTDRRAERHRLRCQGRPPVRHGQELAEAVRNTAAPGGFGPLKERSY